MRGITPRREQGMADPVLAEMVHATGATESRHYAAVKPTIQAFRASWVRLAPYRDGPVNSQRVTVDDPAAMTAQDQGEGNGVGREPGRGLPLAAAYDRSRLGSIARVRDRLLRGGGL